MLGVVRQHQQTPEPQHIPTMSPAASRAFRAGWACAASGGKPSDNPHEARREHALSARWAQGFREQLGSRTPARTFSYLFERNTGAGPQPGKHNPHAPTLLEWAEKQLRRQRMSDDTKRLAAVLESQGVQARQGKDGIITGLPLVTFKHDTVDDFRNVNILPGVAARNRRPVLMEILYFLEQNPQIRKYVRYGVITSGRRVPLYGDLRGRFTGLHRAISKWAHWARHEFGIELLHRATEDTVDPALSFHVHANVLYWPTRKLSEADWMRFRDGTENRMLGTWRDNGRAKDIRELVKYVMKGDDLNMLVDAAELVPEWSGHGDPAGYAVAYARHCAKQAKAEDFGPWLLDGYHAAQDMRQCLTRLRTDCGAAHPIVWLAGQLHGLTLSQSMGPLARWRRDLHERGRKIVYEQTPRGPVLVEYEKPKRDREKAKSQPVADENQLITITLAHPRTTPWAEPVALIRNYNPRPTTGESAARLKAIIEAAAVARAAWDRAGAPEPRQALAHAAMLLSAVEGPQASFADGGRPLAGSGGEAVLYGSQTYDNCPQQDDAASGGRVRVGSQGICTDTTTGEILGGWEPGAKTAADLAREWPELDPYHPENWCPAGKNVQSEEQVSYWERMRGLGVSQAIESFWYALGPQGEGIAAFFDELSIEGRKTGSIHLRKHTPAATLAEELAQEGCYDVFE
ncbi:hypothetical protein ACM64Y_01865 [Novispirillum sp. DQ9]|uniref:hypothetical protein n=1 Tax=Novispirillum sp. DQ9 TaxID=3398612 RepID=UPI003C7C7698